MHQGFAARRSLGLDSPRVSREQLRDFIRGALDAHHQHCYDSKQSMMSVGRRPVDLTWLEGYENTTPHSAFKLLCLLEDPEDAREIIEYRRRMGGDLACRRAGILSSAQDTLKVADPKDAAGVKTKRKPRELDSDGSTPRSSDSRSTPRQSPAGTNSALPDLHCC